MEKNDVTCLNDFLEIIFNIDNNIDEILKKYFEKINDNNNINIKKLSLSKYYKNDRFKIDFNRFSNKFKNIYQYITFFYRGQFNNEYKLIPFCFRDDYLFEENQIKNYAISNYPDEFRNLNQLEILVKMQHYGFPTRILNVTTNPLVALYFACKNFSKKCENSTGSVYIFCELNAKILSKFSDKAIMFAALSSLNNKDKNLLYSKCYDAYLHKKQLNCKIGEKFYHEICKDTPFENRIKSRDLLRNYYLIPPFNNERIKNQNGAFIITGLSKDNKEMETKINNEVLFKIDIDNKYKSIILNELDNIGINEKFLFPELEHVIKYFKEKKMKEVK